MVMLRVSRMQAVNYRLVVNNLSTPSAGWLICRGRVRRVAGHRTPWRSARPARSGGGVRAGRVAAFAPGPDLQPRAAVYVLLADDFGVFTVGRLRGTRRRGRFSRIWPRSRALLTLRH